MPMYDYECTKCGATFDEYRPANDHSTARCACGGVAHHVWLRAPAGKVADDWSIENNGKGREITQLNRGPFEKDKVYMKSRNQLEETAKRMVDKGELKSYQRA